MANGKNNILPDSLTFKDIVEMARELDSLELREAYAVTVKKDGGSKAVDELYEEIKKEFNKHDE